MPKPIGETPLVAVFESMWESLDRELRAIVPSDPAAPKARKRDTADLLEELIERVKGLEALSAFDVGAYGQGVPIGAGRRLVSTMRIAAGTTGDSAALRTICVSPPARPARHPRATRAGAAPTPRPKPH